MNSPPLSLSTLAPFKDIEARLPFPLRGVDSDNGGEFINPCLSGWHTQAFSRREGDVLALS